MLQKLFIAKLQQMLIILCSSYLNPKIGHNAPDSQSALFPSQIFIINFKEISNMLLGNYCPTIQFLYCKMKCCPCHCLLTVK